MFASSNPVAPGIRNQYLLVLTFSGLLSGIVCAAQPFPDFIPTEASIGIIFGIIVGGTLWKLGLIQPARILLFIISSEVCWLLAYYFAKDVTHDLINNHWYRMLIVGLLSGILGAASLAICCRVLLTFFRSMRLLFWTSVLGGVTGALLYFDSEYVLFPVWQAGFAFCLAMSAQTQSAKPRS
jgi:hypothetical protein